MVTFETPVILTIELTDLPSTIAAITCACFVRLSLFMKRVYTCSCMKSSKISEQVLTFVAEHVILGLVTKEDREMTENLTSDAARKISRLEAKKSGKPRVHGLS